ncbi:MAG: pyruvate kinase [Planctomycetota bacterium]|nr:pyruvate kinase [Planctomycetota bacterium]
MPTHPEPAAVALASEVPAPPILASIVATIGPASDSPETIRRLIAGGVAVFRFNFSHGGFDAHERRLKAVRETAESMGVQVACLGDLQGPKIRVGTIPAGVGETSSSGGGSVVVAVGQDVVFSRNVDLASVRAGDLGPEPVLPVTYPALVDEVTIGQKVLINDGAIRMLAVESNPARGELRCRVTVGGRITSGKGINLPQSVLSAPAVTEQDWACVEWAVRHGLDFLALSFVRTADEVRALKAHLDGVYERREGPWIPVVSKIEMPAAVANLDAIVDASDAVMVARGDLGVEMDLAQVPVVQKRIVRTCALYGKPCIVATQMLESMIENASPTRAEASDVANAILDGADAVMLSAETATGRHPALVVETMARIVDAAETLQRERNDPHAAPTRLTASHRGTAALAQGAYSIAHDLRAVAVVCWSENGGTARYLSQNRFHIPIIACSSDARACRRMALLRSVTPICMTPPGTGTLSEWNAAMDQYLVAKGIGKPGDAVVLLAGRPLGQAKKTNTLTIHKIGEATGFTQLLA